MLIGKTESDGNIRFSRRDAIVCVALLALAFGVRFVVWQNNKIAMDGVQYVVTHLYKEDARTLLRGDVGTFLAGPNPPSDASVLLHPPGYPLFIAAAYGIFGENEGLRIFQIFLCSFASILIFLIARRLFDFKTGVIAGILVAVAPQFAYYSAIILPDELSVLPILLAVYFLVRAVEDKRLTMAIFCGVSIGLSCWLRSNAMVLPLFFAASSMFLLPKQIRLKFSVMLIAAFVLTISPITIRNYAVFKSFIPVSLGMGTTFVEGLGDYDPERRFGVPSTDKGVMEMDALHADRPDYYGQLLNPDGVNRERERIKIGLSVVGSNPGWYLKSVLHRGFTTLRMERVPANATERDEKDTTIPALYYLNVPLKLFQKLFITAIFLPLTILGVIILLIEKERRAKLMILAVVPLYYMSVQALIHTEYRYVLAMTHILMIISAVSLSFLAGKIYDLISARSKA